MPDHLQHDLRHTDAYEQARFRKLAPEEQMMEIWLNTRETNGHVAEALNDIAAIKKQREVDLDLARAEREEWRKWRASVDARAIVQSTVIGVALFLVPIVLTLLGYLEWK